MPKANEFNEIQTKEIEEKIGYSFKNKHLLEQAFTRRAFRFSEKYNIQDNELLEFIGDSIVGMVVVKELAERYRIHRFVEFSDESLTTLQFCAKRQFENLFDEAELSEMKIELVQRNTLARATERMGLEEYLFLGKNDIAGRVWEQASVKEDLFEAIIGAIAIDSGWNMGVLEEAVKRLMDIETLLEEGADDEEDYEQLLADWFAEKGKSINYAETSALLEKNLNYAVSVNLGVEMLSHVSIGYGKTLKGARRMAAKDAIEFIRKTNDRAEAIIRAVGEPSYDKAINQLQELYYKKFIPEPKYVFEECDEKSELGNPQWMCHCSIDGLIDMNGGYICDTKAEAKKAIAFEVMQELVGIDVVSQFLTFGKEIKKDINEKNNSEGEKENERD